MTQEYSSAITDLYKQHNSWLVNWLRRKIDCPHRALDLAHDTFLKIISRADAQEIRQPRSYLSTIANGLVVDHYRRRSLEQAYQEYLLLQPEEVHISLEEQALIVEALVSVDKLLDSMGKKAKQAFLLSQLDGLTYLEIAKQMGISVSSVQKYMTQAMQACYQVCYE